MLTRNTILDYSTAIILSTAKKSFEALGRAVKKSGDTISRWLCPATESFDCMEEIASHMFEKIDELRLVIDDTTISKIHSKNMEGSMRYYCSKTGRLITAYKLIVVALTDGKYVVPLSCALLFPKEIEALASIESKDGIVQRFVLATRKRFPNKKFVVVVDGAFATKVLLRWFVQNKIDVEVRIQCNRKVLFNGNYSNLRDIKELQPKGRRRARTIKATWHEIPLYFTSYRRIDRHGNESIVFHASTYRAKPIQHVRNYQQRWGIEKLFRTTKQHLGLQECFSRKIETQFNHMAAVMLTYAISQFERKKRKLDTPEEAIRALKLRNYASLKNHLIASNRIFGGVHA